MLRLKLYNEDFEDAFLKATIKYYSKKAQAWIMVDTCTEYMVKVIEVLLKILFYSVRTHTDWFFH
jgi:cullin 1